MKNKNLSARNPKVYSRHEVSTKENARESVGYINDSLWEYGGPESIHVTLSTRESRMKLPRLLFNASKQPGSSKRMSQEQTRGYLLFTAFKEKDQVGTMTKSVLITPDNKFTTVAREECMMRSGIRGLNYTSPNRSDLICPIEMGEEREPTVIVDPENLLPLSELPEPEQVLGRLAVQVNDRLSYDLGWHIDVNDDGSMDMGPGRILYM
jgi:hypothetical protein